MASGTTSPARSIYRGVRATVTAHPGTSTAWLSLSVKRADAPWHEWDSICPAVRVDMGEIRSTRDVLLALGQAVLEAADREG